MVEPTSAGLRLRYSVRLVVPDFWIASASMETTGLAKSVSGREMREPVMVTSGSSASSLVAGASCAKAPGDVRARSNVEGKAPQRRKPVVLLMSRTPLSFS